MATIPPYSTIYVVNPEFIAEICEELNGTSHIIENLVFSPDTNTNVCFAQDIWLNPQQVSIASISEAVNVLRTAGKFWYLHPISHVRRSRLIEQQLRKLPPLQRSFPIEDEIPAIGCFTLLDQNTMIFSTQRLKKWPQGKCLFIEDKTNPPNRAYLKLWEALSLFKRYPTQGETVLDLGASPGGWTYVIQSLGASVTAVDKAPLADNIAALPRVHYQQQSAFAIDPTKLDNHYDWVLSDVACYPERAYELILKWLDSGKAKHMIFTIKLQGKTDIEIIKRLQMIPNSRMTHLFYNKHEVTFLYPSTSLSFNSFKLIP
jgi:23S rRNA (cytidine2498-2'-O)-methyltransferase